MASARDEGVAKSIRSELESTRSSFHGILDSLSEEDLLKAHPKNKIG